MRGSWNKLLSIVSLVLPVVSGEWIIETRWRMLCLSNLVRLNNFCCMDALGNEGGSEQELFLDQLLLWPGGILLLPCLASV